MLSKYEEELWFRATFLSANDMYGEVEKVIFLANEITKEKEMELASRKQHEQLIRKEEELRLSGLDLKKKLDETNQLKLQQKEKLEKEIRQYTHVLEKIPFPMISINNLGFIQFFNRHAEKSWDRKRKEVLGQKVNTLFHPNNSSRIIQSLIDPARNKAPGLYPDQEVVLADGTILRKELMLIRTDLKDEVQYTLLIL